MNGCLSLHRKWGSVGLWEAGGAGLRLDYFTVPLHSPNGRHFPAVKPRSHRADHSLDVPDHSRPPRSVMIVAKPSDRGLSTRSLSVQDCQYDISTTAVRHWYDGSVWSTLSTFSTTISMTTDTINTTARTMLTTTPTLLPICYHD